MMSDAQEITREDLELIDFERVNPEDDLPYYRRRFHMEYVEFFQCNDSDKYENYRYNHINTLPKLRQLIRSLFGDDALPRRELSSITDEECLLLLNSVYKGDTKIEGTIKDNAQESFILSIYGDKYTLSIHGTGHMECYSDNYNNRHYPNFSKVLFLLFNMDFHLPAFHGD